MCVAILFAVVYASPIALDESTKKQSDKSDSSIPLKVVDVPAGVFDIPASESVDKKVEDKIQPDAETPVDVKQIEILDDLNKPQKEGEDVAEEGPNVFGIRFPSILIIRRPAVFQDPFAGFQSPFFSGRPNRPSIFSSFGSSFDDEQQNKEKVDEKEALPSSIDQQEDEQQRNETVIANNVIQRMHQQIGNLFANLFNPDTFFMPRPNYQRPTFPRPTFSRPSLFSPFSGFDETEDDEKLDFDKLPANYSNSTSETKIVDGQLVTVNKTVHRISGNNSNGFFHFSVIKVRPNEPVAEKELPTAVPSDTPLKISEGETKPVEFAEPDPKMNEVDRPEDEQVSNKGVDNGLLA